MGATILKRFWRLFIPRIVFFCFLFFSFAFYQRDALFERSLYILDVGWRRSKKKKRNVSTPSESVYASLREGVSIVLSLLSLPTSFFLYSHAHKHLNLEFSPLSLKKKTKKKKKKKKRGFPLFPGKKKKKKKKKS